MVVKTGECSADLIAQEIIQHSIMFKAKARQAIFGVIRKSDEMECRKFFEIDGNNSLFDANFHDNTKEFINYSSDS
ncbi:hypothetical protein BpHYR1_038206 [Brachionus plicatilis]|uniref:Uncharacterized protein n=1 Tax=Brachionus plicatilis TaxID=10195 RepID=A0A3M7P8L7_BRAPC|nr:hypothetical protein BpHYR1_038206 [Brachionus plicatilis]